MGRPAPERRGIDAQGDDRQPSEQRRAAERSQDAKPLASQGVVSKANSRHARHAHETGRRENHAHAEPGDTERPHQINDDNRAHEPAADASHRGLGQGGPPAKNAAKRPAADGAMLGDSSALERHVARIGVERQDRKPALGTTENGRVFTPRRLTAILLACYH